jgi:hypothetical protein
MNVYCDNDGYGTTNKNANDDTSILGNHAHKIDDVVEHHGLLGQEDDEMENAIQSEL